MRPFDHVRVWMPVLGTAIFLAMLVIVPDKAVVTSKQFFTYCVIGLLAVFVVLAVLSYPVKRIREAMIHRGPFWFGLIIALGVYEYVTLKMAALPMPFFPSLTKISETFMADYDILIECIVSSLKVLFWGFLLGTVLGVITGVALGLLKKFNYWIEPIFRFIGPTPPAALAPVALIIAPTSFVAAVFLIVFSVWYPVTVQTLSGVTNLSKDYFEVARTMGGNRWYQLRHIVMPGIMPTVFFGVYIGFCYSFMTLIVADMMGSTSGLGWFINWAMGWGAYYRLYAGLFIIALMCFLLIGGMFKFRDWLLRWQGEGASL